MIKEPERDMRGFVLELKRVNPTMVRGETLIEVTGAERFIADTVYIPEDRRGLYSDDDLALKFANGRIIRDTEIKNSSSTLDNSNIAFEREIWEKLRELHKLFNDQYSQRV